MPGRNGHTRDRVRRAVHEPGDPRPTDGALDINQDRGLDVIGFPDLVPPPPRPGQEHIVLPGCTLTTVKPRPLPRSQITPDRPMQRRNRRRQITLAPGRASGQLTVDSSDVPLPQPEQSPNLVSDQEPPAVGARSPGGSQPPPHRPIPHPQSVRRHPNMPRSGLPLPAQSQQAANHRPPQRPHRHSRQSPARPATRPRQGQVLCFLIHLLSTPTPAGPRIRTHETETASPHMRQTPRTAIPHRSLTPKTATRHPETTTDQQQHTNTRLSLTPLSRNREIAVTRVISNRRIMSAACPCSSRVLH